MTGEVSEMGEPMWEPGTATGYHAITFGYLVGEVIRRISGQSPGRFFGSEIAGPLGADFHIGLAEGELGRCSVLQGVRPSEEEQAAVAQAYANAHPAAMAALTNPALTGDEANEDDWRMAEIPAANGYRTALALATVFGTLADGSEQLISAATLRAACTGQGRFTDLVLGFPLDWGLGFALSGPEHHTGPALPLSATTASAGPVSARTLTPESPSPTCLPRLPARQHPAGRHRLRAAGGVRCHRANFPAALRDRGGPGPGTRARRS